MPPCFLSNRLYTSAICSNRNLCETTSDCLSMITVVKNETALPSGSKVPSWMCFRQVWAYLCPGFCEQPTKVILTSVLAGF